MTVLPMSFTKTKTNGKFQFTTRQISGNIDSGKKKETGTSAMDKFKKMDSLGQTDGTSINTTHQSTITCVRPYKGESGRVSQFSTTGVDGQLAVWDILNAGIANLKI